MGWTPIHTLPSCSSPLFWMAAWAGDGDADKRAAAAMLRTVSLSLMLIHPPMLVTAAFCHKHAAMGIPCISCLNPLTMKWNPTQYDKFNAAREAPLYDLLALIDKRPGLRVIDLGCGPGNITVKLAAALPDSDVLGIDSSAEMLATAAELAGWRYDLASLDISAYAEILYAHGVTDLTVFEKVYPHVLADADAVLEWGKGTALLPYLERL